MRLKLSYNLIYVERALSHFGVAGLSRFLLFLGRGFESLITFQTFFAKKKEKEKDLHR
jgi:hypothetical protein